MESAPQPFRPNLALAMLGFVVLFGLGLAGVRAMQGDRPPIAPPRRTSAAPGTGGFTNNPVQGEDQVALQAQSPATRTPGGAVVTPTPDAPHPLPPVRSRVEQYTVQPGDSLASIALRYQVSLDQIVQENNLADPNHVEVGQVLTVPLPSAENGGPDFKVIPDSELVNGPAASGFDVQAFVDGYAGYLSSYQGEVEGKVLTGAEIVARVAQDYSVNPRLLLAVLEYQSGWVTQNRPAEATVDYPVRLINTNWKGLYRQLAWAANQLNRGFYLWRVNGAGAWALADGDVIPVSPLINAGTAGVQNMFAQLTDRAGWMEAVTEGGLFETYNALFGYPFDYAVEPLLPDGLQQPSLELPLEPGRPWSFTGGPHGGWADGSAWAALDFAPPGEALGCVPSEEWVTAVAAGPIVRAANGAVIQDLDVNGSPADGLEQTGWTILYMHIDTQDRVKAGTYLKTGDRIGHPSCEGGISNGTHVHLARKYNGEWIAADQPSLPFVLSGWVSSGAGKEYDGYLSQGNKTIEAYEGREKINQIQR